MEAAQLQANVQLIDQFWTEGASVGDRNNDGVNDTRRQVLGDLRPSLGDLDGDRLRGLVTGKRFWSHGGPAIPIATTPPSFTGSDWFAALGPKRSTFVLVHEKKTVTSEEWQRAQPKRQPPVGR